MNRPLIALSLDGGGVRSLSSLLILYEIIKRLINKKRRGLRAGDIFNLVCGTSGGGLCAMMLTRLNFDIPECVAHLSNVSNTVFAGGPSLGGRLSKGLLQNKYSAAKLENAIHEIRHTNKILGHATYKCYVVCRETTRSGVLMPGHRPLCLASFPNGQPDCQVWQAARATSAAQTFFSPMRLDGRYCTDGGILHNNPIITIDKQLTHAGWNKPLKQECYVSIGTGKASPAGEEAARNSWRPANIFNPITNLLNAATTSEKDAEIFQERCEELHQGPGGKVCHYFRFNCDNGLASFDLDRADKLPEIIRLTQEYLQNDAVQQKIDVCVTALSEMV